MRNPQFFFRGPFLLKLCGIDNHYEEPEYVIDDDYNTRKRKNDKKKAAMLMKNK